MRAFLRAWLAAKLLPLVVRLAAWAAWVGAFAGYAGYVAWKVRRLVKRGALDAREPGDPPLPVSAKDEGVGRWIRGDEPIELAPTSADEPTPR